MRDDDGLMMGCVHTRLRRCVDDDVDHPDEMDHDDVDDDVNDLNPS